MWSAEGGRALNYETFLEDVHAVRDRAGRFRVDAGACRMADTLAAAALEELDVALEELRVAEEEVRTQQEALDEGRRRSEAERERYQALFLLAPAAYVVTDPAGLIREANLRAVALLGSTAGSWPASRSSPSWTPATAGGSATTWPASPAGSRPTGRSGCGWVAGGAATRCG